MAVDLREIVGALKTSGDLEHVGALMRSIAERALSLQQSAALASRDGFERLAQLVLVHLCETTEAYLTRNETDVAASAHRSKRLEAACTMMSENLSAMMRDDPQSVQQGIHLLFCVANVQAISDRIARLTETLYYIVEGRPMISEYGQPKSAMAFTV